MKIIKYIIIVNFIILYINIIIFIIPNKPSLINFRNIDSKFLIFSKMLYKNISDYLSSKYQMKFYNINEEKNNNIIKKKKIKLYFIDFKYSKYRESQKNRIKEILSKDYEIFLTPLNPEYLIYNVFGCDHIKNIYKRAIKIAYYTENKIPDFSMADYAVAQVNINYLDRYLKIPYIIGRYNIINNSFIGKRRESLLKNLPKKKKFCAAVISNYRNYSRFRLDFINQLNKYKKVDMGGKYKNNVGKIKNKILFLSSYKFSIAMENSEADGYFSEKIIDAFLAGTIPIYYGNYMIDEYINPNSYILIRGKNDIKEKIEYIKKIDNDDNLFQKIIHQNILIDEKFKEKIEKQKIQFLTHIFEQDQKKAKRIDNYIYKIN